MTKRCGIIAIVGEPNAGKSTLVNRMVGGKVSIVTPKAQTTRFNVRGVCAQGESQLIFIDTPGIFDAPKPFEKAMVKAAWTGMGDADAVLFLLDAEYGLKESVRKIISHLHPDGKPIAIALNKIDNVKKPQLLELATACNELGVFSQIFMISALNGDGVQDVKLWLAGVVPEGPWLYPDDQMSDISMSLLAAEITREKIFMHLGQELPYAIFVENEHWQETEGTVRISQAIYVQREGQKKIVIGAGGSKLKEIGSASRKELSSMLQKPVHLELFVKVKPGWKENPEHYNLMGLEFKK